MNCCVECFASSYIQDIVSSNSKGTGDCNFCDNSNVAIYDPRKLLIHFRSFCELYVPFISSSDTPSNSLIEKQIVKDFPQQIFSFQNPNTVKQILTEILQDESDDFDQIFTQPVILSCHIDSSTKKKADDLKVSWGVFSDEIRSENRYHITNQFDLKKLAKLLGRYVGGYSAGKMFYRARISDKEGYPVEKMGNPPSNVTSHGRANPEGISYLYVSNDIDTTLYETRSSLFDYVTVGEFVLNKPMTTVNLRQAHDFDPMPMAEQEDLNDFLVYLPFISHLSEALSKPIRRNDNELDYYPTQYLSEFIKSLGYDGIEYASSLNPQGYNIAIFNTDLLECKQVSVKEIKEIRFLHSPVS